MSGNLDKPKKEGKKGTHRKTNVSSNVQYRDMAAFMYLTGKNQKEFAAALGVTGSHISRIVNNNFPEKLGIGADNKIHNNIMERLEYMGDQFVRSDLFMSVSKAYFFYLSRYIRQMGFSDELLRVFLDSNLFLYFTPKIVERIATSGEIFKSQEMLKILEDHLSDFEDRLPEIASFHFDLESYVERRISNRSELSKIERYFAKMLEDWGVKEFMEERKYTVYDFIFVWRRSDYFRNHQEQIEDISKQVEGIARYMQSNGISLDDIKSFIADKEKQRKQEKEDEHPTQEGSPENQG